MLQPRAPGPALCLAGTKEHGMSGRSVGPVSINIADEAELAAIAEIGLQRAKRIIEYRTRHGEFESIDELTRVAGIDQKLVDSIRGSITL